MEFGSLRYLCIAEFSQLSNDLQLVEELFRSLQATATRTGSSAEAQTPTMRLEFPGASHAGAEAAR